MPPHVTRRTVVRSLIGAPLVGGALGAGAPSALAAPARRPRADDARVQYRAWVSAADWKSGAADGVRVRPGDVPAIEIAEPTGTREYADPHTGETRVWETAAWTSPVHAVDFAADELIASWNAETPDGTWIEVALRGDYSGGGSTPWYVLGRWASGDADMKRTSVNGQKDDRSEVATDTVLISDKGGGAGITGYRIRVTLLRAEGGSATPAVRRVGAMASTVPDRFTVPASKPGVGSGVELEVPRYSQNTHVGDYPEYDNGGEAWCSPTSSQMVLEHFGRVPTEEDLDWVEPPDHHDPSVDHAARFTYDYAYEGCGNWPFNTAYAATYRQMSALVTRLGSMADAERLIAAGVPIITSQSFEERELDGAGYGTAGHLMVLIGFTEDGDVIANDPASPSNDAVRRVYPRRQFENIWLRTKRKLADGSTSSGSGGVCYLFFPEEPGSDPVRALRELGIR
ncbi:peptidase C39-like protein [Murinocardiopsis flavida]|uniref:Peptidase C39-like protein n=1 Tax=Murinocardiopsis flavida TaxID=645275 RepID=A0A2P8DTQ8_9ACTN|nr:peptidase C39 family protein [Murinocardiopsis flavida]PSL00608.1 peptidase C39-like protein [Murinocardiopsis flavida]